MNGRECLRTSTNVWRSLCDHCELMANCIRKPIRHTFATGETSITFETPQKRPRMLTNSYECLATITNSWRTAFISPFAIYSPQCGTSISEPSTVSNSVINSLPHRPEETCLDDIPTIQEVEKAISQIKDNKSAVPDGIPPELFTHGGQTVASHLQGIFVKISIDEVIPADMRNANIITIFKKNDRHNINNHRGISLLAVVGKIMALVMLNGYDLRRQTTYGEGQRTTP